MGSLRKPFQGVLNILRFNWHFYLLSACILTALSILYILLPSYRIYLLFVGLLTVISSFVSLLSAYYIYDLSELYSFKWIPAMGMDKRVINISAGFDEISGILRDKYPNSELEVFDFYDPKKHTEVSIKRARNAYPRYPGTRRVQTHSFPLGDDAADKVFVMLSAHEVRDTKERVEFFQEIRRIMKSDAQLIVVEHLRDRANFIAFNFGFFHFYTRSTWQSCFKRADFMIRNEIKITPFISAFILEKHGSPL